MYTFPHDKHNSMIPLMLDLSNSRVLVLGAGAVGTRKAGYFSEACREMVTLDTVPENLEETLQTFDIIIAATASASLNETICKTADRLGKWYNSATGVGNFLIPATYQEDRFTLAVSTSGKSPAAAAFIRDKICEAYPSLPAMIELQGELREELKETIAEQPKRAAILRNVLEDPAVWEALDAGDYALALKRARRHQ